MAASNSVNDVSGWLDERLAAASPDLLREMVKQFAEASMSAEADAACGAGYRERSEQRVTRATATGCGTGTPASRASSWPFRNCGRAATSRTGLLERRRRAEQALVSVVATNYLLGVSTRRVEKLVGQLGIAQLSKSQVSEMAKSLDAQGEAFRSRPLDASPYTFLWLDALTHRVREHGRTVIVHALIAVGVTADGQREVLGLDVVSGEDGAGWLAFLRNLVARGLSAVIDRGCRRDVCADCGVTACRTSSGRCGRLGPVFSGT
jgi:transposase-like protein